MPPEQSVEHINAYGPTVPLEELVERVNLIFHSIVAADYDQRHPEIHQQLPPIWDEMLRVGLQGRQPQALRVLDFGCGTGFASEQALRNWGDDGIAHLTCFDPSHEMLAQARRKLAGDDGKRLFTSDLHEVLRGQYDMVLTNSLLHHLPSPVDTIRSLLPTMTVGATWLAGHEPSRRFFENRDCAAAYAALLRASRLKKLLSPRTVLTRIGWLFGTRSDALARTASRIHEEGLLERVPSPRVVDHLIDFHVPHSLSEVEKGRGLAFDELRDELAPELTDLWHTSYAFLGHFLESKVGSKWRAKAESLAEQYPDDGSCFCAVFAKPAAS